MIPEAKTGDRPRTTDMRQVINDMLYVLRGGITWRMLPNEFPSWQTVYGYYNQWSKIDLFDDINDKLIKEVIVAAGRNEIPTTSILDSQTSPNAAKAKDKGCGGKILLLALGNKLSPPLNILKIWTDGGYRGKLI